MQTNIIQEFARTIGFWEINDLPTFTELTKLEIDEDRSLFTKDSVRLGGFGKITYSIAGKKIAVSESDGEAQTFRFTFHGKVLLKACVDEIISHRISHLDIIK